MYLFATTYICKQALTKTKVTKTKQKRDRQRSYERNIEEPLRNHGCHGKAISITHSECVSVESSWNLMAYGDAREGKRRGNRRMELELEHGLSSITANN